MDGVLNGRAFVIFTTTLFGVLNILNARSFMISRAPPECPRMRDIQDILNASRTALNARAFRAKSGRGAGVMSILNARAFRIFRTRAHPS